MLRAVLIGVALCALLLGSSAGAAPLGQSTSGQSTPSTAGAVARTASDAEMAGVTLPGDAGLKHVGTWLGVSEEVEEKEPLNDSSAEELQHTFALLSEAFSPVHGRKSNLFGYGLLDTEPHHEWIARLERPPCVRTVAPFI